MSTGPAAVATIDDLTPRHQQILTAARDGVATPGPIFYGYVFDLVRLGLVTAVFAPPTGAAPDHVTIQVSADPAALAALLAAR
jgi:hypothetical protein